MREEDRLNPILEDLKIASSLSDYEAVDVLWVALIKIANFMEGESEHRRLTSLVEKIPEKSIRKILQESALDVLLELDPPLETVLVNRHERLFPDEAEQAVEQIKKFRESDPKTALVSLGKVLKRIRNKRVHGFKTRSGDRDKEILCAARSLLQRFCEVGLEKIK